jgi:soluble lytic murein transglycosylase-like protein
MKKTFLTLSIVAALIFTSIIISNSFAEDTKKELCADSNYNKLPESIKLYDYIVKYSEQYSVPINIAFGIANKESGYNGPAHLNYNPKLTSKSKAYGPMQIKLSTANLVSDKKITRSELLNNTELNVQLSLKLLSELKKRYGSWKLALGAYNTGRPIVNKYAKTIIKFKIDKFIPWIQKND